MFIDVLRGYKKGTLCGNGLQLMVTIFSKALIGSSEFVKNMNFLTNLSFIATLPLATAGPHENQILIIFKCKNACYKF